MNMKKRTVLLSTLLILFACIYLFRKTFFGTDDDNSLQFHRVEDGLYISSAFFDDRHKEMDGHEYVSVMGIGARRSYANIYCIFMDENGQTLYQVPGTFRTFLQALSKPSYHPVLISCLLSKTALTVPYSVSILSFQKNSNAIPVHYPGDETIYKMGACIQPLFDFEDPMGVIEWIEYHRMLGVDHFTFYNVSIGPKTSEVLRSYPDVVKVFQWHMPINPEHIHYFGQVLQINDCLYRYRGVADYVMSIDVDEFLSPGPRHLQNFTSLYDFFQANFLATERIEGMKVAAFTFSSQFSFTHFPANFTHLEDILTEEQVFGERRRELRRLGRQIKVLTRNNLGSSWRFTFKAKHVMKTELIEEAEVHWPTLWSKGSKPVHLLESEISYIHYRSCTSQYIKDYCTISCVTGCNLEHKEDTSISEKFGKDLLYRVDNKLDRLKEFQNLQLI